jgi:hypothetical protein
MKKHLEFRRWYPMSSETERQRRENECTVQPTENKMLRWQACRKNRGTWGLIVAVGFN